MDCSVIYMGQGAPREGNPMNMQFVTRGNGKAIHIQHVWSWGEIATVCNTWFKPGQRSIRVLPIAAEEATCKSCLKIMASKEVSA